MFLFLFYLHYLCPRVVRRRHPAGGGLNSNQKSKRDDYAMKQPNTIATNKRVLVQLVLQRI